MACKLFLGKKKNKLFFFFFQNTEKKLNKNDPKRVSEWGANFSAKKKIRYLWVGGLEGGTVTGRGAGTAPLNGSFYGNCREWLGNHTTSIVSSV